VADVALQPGEGGHHGDEELALAGRWVAACPLAGEDPGGDAAGVEGTGDREHLLDGAAGPARLPDDDRVTGAQVAGRRGEAGGLGGGLPGADLLELDPAAPGEGWRVLELGVLGAGADAGQACEVVVYGHRSGSVSGTDRALYASGGT